MGGQHSDLYKYDFDHAFIAANLDIRDPPERNHRPEMEAEYVGHYLGSAMLTKGTTGLGVIQKPLREKYFAFRKSSENKLGPEIGIRVNPRGLVLLFPGTHPGHPNDEFYDIASIHFIEAVNFVTVKQKDKRYYGAFVPIDDNMDMYPNQDKLFVQLEKKFTHLTKIPHPPMVACVMRRPTGVKAVDCHMFVIPVVEDALRLADMVHRFQERPDNPEFYNRRDLPPEPDVIPRNLGQPPSDRRSRDSDTRNSEDYTIYKGGRGLELKQEHFMRGPDVEERAPERERMPPPPNVDLRYGYPRNRPDNAEVRDRFSSSSNYDKDREGNRNSREIARPGGRFVERDSLGNEHEFDNKSDNRVIHQRQRSGEDPDFDRYSGERHAGFASRNEFSDRRADDRRPDNYPGKYRDPSPPEIRRGAPSWQNRGPRDNSRTPSGGYDDPPYTRPIRRSPSGSPRNSREIAPPRGRSPPRGHLSPRGPPSPRSQSPDDNVYSASNLESRMEESQVGKPVAKVPPIRKGIRVLPSLPILDVKNQLKPVSPRSPEAPSKIEEKPPSYNYNMKQDTYTEEKIYDNASLNRHNRPHSEVSPRMHRRSDERSNVKSDDYSYKFNSGHQQTKPWSYEDEKEKFLKSRDAAGSSGGWNSANKSKSFQDGVKEPNYNEEMNGRGGHHVKDLEIADMFGNLRTSSNYNKDVDFESSLGYLP